jgi:hypothetical protein
MKISRYSPISKTHELANKWMEKEGIPRQEGVYPVSKYQPLRYALEDGDIERAKEEYKKLIDSKMTRKKIALGFKSSIQHPFTGKKETDEKFSKQLKDGDKLIYENAMAAKKSILHKYGMIFSSSK